MRTCGLEIIRTLQLSQETQILGEHEQYHSGKAGRGKQGESIQAKEPGYEVELVARTVVNTGTVAKGVVEVC